MTGHMERLEDDTSVTKMSFRWNTQDSEVDHSQDFVLCVEFFLNSGWRPMRFIYSYMVSMWSICLSLKKTIKCSNPIKTLS